MDAKAALKTRLENLSPEQRAALLQQISRLRQQQEVRPDAAQRYPLSLAQRRLWMLAQLGSEASAAYNIAAAFCFDQGLDAEQLQRAWRRLLGSHEVLRSAFIEEGGELFQLPRAESGWTLRQQALNAGQEVEAQLLQLAQAETALPFDLQHDWLLRVIYCAADSGQAGLIVVIHHSICDGLSIASMIRELARYYDAAPDAAIELTDQRSTALQYRDYVDHEARADTSKARTYWKEIFASAPETLDGLLDLPRPVQKDFRGSSVALTLAAPEAAAFEALCHAHNATLYMGLVALVQTVLARFANVGEVTLGTPVAGRPGAQFDGVVGPFVNTIALRQTIDHKQSFAELLLQVRRRVLGGFQHQGLAFDELVTELGFAKDPSRSPLYDAMLGFTAAEDLALRFGSSAGRALRIPLAFSKVDLTFHFEKASDGSLRLDLEYASGVLLATTAQRLCEAWRLLTLAISQQPGLALGECALHSAADRRELVEQINATARPYPQHSSIVAEFRRSVQSYPDAIAVHAGDVQLSYRVLDAVSDQLAASLLSHPAYTPGCHIALLLEKDQRALIVMLAILKSRAVYVPLAANTPLERIGDVIATGAVRLLFAETARIEELQALAIALIDIAALPGTGAVPSAPQGVGNVLPFSKASEAGAVPEPAYLMFTSGSTGKPKGTLIEQRSVLRLVCNTDYHQVQAHERVLLTGSLAFDAATFEIWGPLLNGGCVCIPAGTTLLDVHEFQTLVDHYKVDTAFLTTGLFNQLVDNSAAAFGRLQTVLTGGEKISVEHVRKLLQAQPALNLLHVYGPTENTTFSTWHRISMPDLALATIPIGRPIANSRLYLLDQNMQPVPVGVPGEIYCGGDGIARGYIEAQAAARSEQPPAFLDDPFLPPGSGRLYRTGDVAKWNHKRELVFVGRNDRQVKVRGFRVELGEVEHHLRSLPGIMDAFVQARGAAGSSELIAWLAAPSGTGLAIGELREALKGRLPNYMLPAKVVYLERFPLNASGKVDARALPLPEAGTSETAVVGQLHGKPEQDLARLYASVLGLTGSAALAIDRDANFFSLGGDSIRAIQLVSLARSAGYHFALKDIFASETLAGLAATAAVTPLAATEALLTAGPLSPTQQWWLECCGKPADHFNLSSVFRVAAPIDIDALRAALDELLELHPALRLTLDTATQQQRIAARGRYVLLEVATAEARELCWQQLQQSIDLEAGILLAVGVAAEADASWLAVVVHHVAADEVSGRLFGENLTRLYHLQLAKLRGASISMLAEPVREALGIVNWAAQLKAAVERGALDHDLAHWQQSVLLGRRILERQQDLFVDTRAARGVAAELLPQRDTQTLLQQGAALLRMAPQDLLLAAFIRAWQRSVGHADCLLSLEGHGREQLEGLGDCSSTLGWFTSLYPFAFGNSGGTALDLYRNVKDQLRRVPSKGWSYLPLRYYKDAAVQQALGIRPQLSFNYLGETVATAGAWLSAAPEAAGADHGPTAVEPFKLDVLARIVDGQIKLTLRGESPRQSLSLAALAAAWLAELRELTSTLQAGAAGTASAQCLLSLSDSLVPFTSLAELDATLTALHLPAGGIEEILPLTGMQAGMWMHCQTHPTAYQDQVALRLQQSLDEARFAAAVRELVAETQALRTGFAQAPHGELLQVVFRERTADYRYIDALANAGVGSTADKELEQIALPLIVAADGAPDLARFRALLRAAPRDLLHDPLFRLTLVRLDAACFELIIDFHHMALDGWTSALLLQRLEALYFGSASGGDRGAASGMRGWFEWLGRQPLAQARAYWQRLLGDYHSRCDVPTQLPRIPAAESIPLFVETRTGAALHARLRSWCEQQGLTISAAVQALWGVFLGRLTGSDDVVFGATVSGRDSDLPAVTSIAGMLINTLPVRIRTAEAETFAALVRTTAQQFAESMGFGHLTLAEIQTLTPARAGLITHALVFENYPASEAAARWHWQPQEIFDPMHFEFGLIVAPLQQDLSFRFVADGSVYLQDGLEKLGSDLCALLAALLDEQQALDVLARGAATAWSLSANFTADSLVGLLQYHEYISGSSGAVTLLPYDQSVQELLNPGSRLRHLQGQQHVVLWRPPVNVSGDVEEAEASAHLAELAAALGTYARACTGSRVYFVVCPWLNCNWTLYREFTAYVKGALAGLHHAEVLSLETLADGYALQQPCHPPALIFGDIPYTEEFFAALANRLVRQRDLQRRKPVKVYVVDADETLWGGIVGEDGVQGIRLEPAHLRLQQLLLNARAAGALICVATKNNEEDVRAVFAERQMPLRWEHFTRVCAGWRPKSESILALAAELSLGLDSFVFIDDSPLECEQVLTACPGVLAIQVPPAQQREAFLQHLWLLDARAATREDAARAQMYAEELQRAGARKATGSYAEFLAALEIRVDLRKLQPGDLPRTAQLAQRTNQFNTTGIRYTEAELVTLLQQPANEIRCVSVSDKYGDYGLTGSVLIRRAAEAWTLFGLLLSCRVLGRGVEHTILRELAREAAGSGARELRVDFVKLARNAPALQFLRSITDGADVQVGAASQQFILPVAEAVRWQPGVAADAETQQDSAAAPGETPAQSDAPNTAPLAARTSSYYSALASRLNSGAAIVHELQHDSVIRTTAVPARGVRTLPATATELALAAYFRELLGPAEVFREDSFHDLGGHSLKAMLLFSRIAARNGCVLDFRDLQAHPTLAALALYIDATADAAPRLAAPELRALPQADSYPLSPGQQRLWMLEQLRGAGPSPFHMHATLTVAGRIDHQALDRAVQTLVQRHEALRTCFRDDSQGHVRQVVLPLTALNVAVHWLAEKLDAAALDAQARQQSELAFNLDTPPLLRIAAGQLSSGGTALFITLHHIISDGWSIGILSSELTRLYQAYSERAGLQPTADVLLTATASAMSDLPQTQSVQFRDFAAWQLEWLASEAGEHAVRFWREHFAEPVEPLQLPAAAPRPALLQHDGATLGCRIPAELWSGFKRHATVLGVSEFGGLFAALQLVLARLSGQRNFCIGTAVAGRPHPQLEAVLGFFVNVLPLRATLDPGSSAAEFLRAVAAEVNACLSHQGVPFDTIVAGLDLVRDPGRTPLFDVLLVLQNTAVDDLRFGAQVAKVHPLASATTQYDLTLSAFPDADGSLALRAEYNTCIYSAANIALLLRCVECALQGLAGSPQQVLANVPWLAAADIAQVQGFEGEPLENTPERLPDIFRRSAATATGSISDAEQSWSYAELGDEMARVARLLRRTSLREYDCGTGQKQLHVGVIGQRSVHSIAALLGVMEAGAIYVPLDLSNPVDRLLLIIAEGGVDILLSTDKAGADLADALTEQLQQQAAGLRDEQQHVPGQPAGHDAQQRLRHIHYADAPPAASQTQDAPRDASTVAYMIFTSGSTGKPKGVQVSHAAFSAMIRQQIPAFDVTGTDICAQFAALSFDASLSEIFLALGTGASLVIAPDAARSDVDTFMQWLSAAAVTVITLPPAFLRALDKRQLGKLRVLITAGEAAIGDDLRHYAATLRVINAYGPTETSVCASTYLVNADDAWPFGVPIGRPLPGVLLTVRDASGARLPLGATGELYIGGATPGEGYYAAPELSAQKFTTLADDPQQRRWYRSGDLVRWRDDGLLEFGGRVDSQVKVRGYRIEPGEIEHAARLVDGVEDAVALVHPQLGLVLYCVTPAAQATYAELRSTIMAALGRALPRYMLPGAVVLLDAFPLTSAGKIARSALLARACTTGTAFIAPATAAEQALAQTWQKVLNTPRVGCADDFFALGGDSIKALEVLNALRTLGFSCELKDFFAAPQLSALAACLGPWRTSARFSEPLQGPVALLPVQNWFLRSRNRETAAHFHIVTECKVAAPVQESLLKEGLAVLINSHDSLRARFYQQDGHWIQDIMPALDVAEVLTCYRRTAAAAARAEREAIELLACRPFAIDSGPLFRCIFVQGPDGCSEALILALHHLVADWVSVRILIADLNALAQNLMNAARPSADLAPPHLLQLVAEARCAELPAPPATEMLSADQQAGTALAAYDHYRKAVAILDALALDCGVHSELHTVHLQLTAAELTALRAYLREQSAALHVELRLQDLLLAAALGELGPLLGSGDIPILVEGHGRDGALDLARQVAWLTRARLITVNAALFTDSRGLTEAQRVLRGDPGGQPDVFACAAAEPVLRSALPALMSFNYLGEFTGSQTQDDLFSLTSTVFDSAMAASSPVDVPLHMEFYVVDNALEIQVAWSPRVFASGTMRACWERVRRNIARR